MTIETEARETEARLLTRKELSAALTAANFKISTATLAVFASRGSGPKYQTFGRTPLYKLTEALQWANDRLAVPSKAKFDATKAA